MSQDLWRIPTSDEELEDIFVEEVGELLESIDAQMRSWANHPDDRKMLTEVRRNFHTLKGSGRMVKALDLSELAWRVEKMLNQAIAGTVRGSDAMVKLVASVRIQIPRMVAAFKNRHAFAGSRDIENLMKVADTLAQGRTPVSAPPPGSTTPVGGEQDRRFKQLHAELEITKQRADEALHRSEMALQEARRCGAQIETQDRSGQRDWYREVDRIGEIVSRLSREVAGLHRDSAKAQQVPSPVQNGSSRVAGQPAQTGEPPGKARLLRQTGPAFEEGMRRDTVTPSAVWASLVLSAMVGAAIATAAIVLIRTIG